MTLFSGSTPTLHGHESTGRGLLQHCGKEKASCDIVSRSFSYFGHSPSPAMSQQAPHASPQVKEHSSEALEIGFGPVFAQVFHSRPLSYGRRPGQLFDSAVVWTGVSEIPSPPNSDPRKQSLEKVCSKPNRCPVSWAIMADRVRHQRV